MRKCALVVAAVGSLVLATIAFAAARSETYSYRTVLTAGAEVPKPKAPVGATGVFTATVTENGAKRSIRWTLTFRKLSGKAMAAHIHRAKRGIAGPVIVPLCGPCTSGMTRSATITKAAADALERGSAYVNVHTAKNAGGEIRGQIKLVKQADTSPAPQPEPQPQPEPPPTETTPYPGY
jgi:hypothetical protein